MTNSWGSLLAVFGVSFGSAVAVVVLVSLALLGLSALAPAGRPDATHALLSRLRSTALVAVCLMAAAAIVLYGLWVTIAS